MCSGLFHIILPSLLVTSLEGDQKLGNGSFALFFFFFPLLPGYPAAVLSIIEEGNALVKWKTQRL